MKQMEYKLDSRWTKGFNEYLYIWRYLVYWYRGVL